MPLLLEAHCAQHIHTETVARVNRHGYTLAYRADAARQRQREQAAAQPGRRARGAVLFAGLRRLRLA